MEKIAAKIPNQWRNIGIWLGFNVSELDSLSSQGLKPDDCFAHIFTKWKERMTVPYSWKKIIQVLKTNLLGQNKLAEDLGAQLRTSVQHPPRYHN